MWKVTAKNESEAEILLYDEISDIDSGEWGLISARGLINRVKALGNVKNITLRINSIGGDVFQAQAIYSYLRTHPAQIIVRVDGLAASAASVIAMSGDKIIMPRNALMMIHNPAGGVYGEADDMRDTAEILDKVRDTIANVYVTRTGLAREKVIAMMDAETWLNADEAKELSFCDEVDEALTVAAMAEKSGIIFRSGFGFSRLDEEIASKMPAGTLRLTPAKEDKSEMEIKNASELESAYPELVSEIRDSAVKHERERLRVLDSLTAPGREAIIARAKYEDPKDPRDIAMELLTADTANTRLKDMTSDSQAVNEALTPQRTPGHDEEQKRIIDMIAKNVNAIRGER